MPVCAFRLSNHSLQISRGQTCEWYKTAELWAFVCLNSPCGVLGGKGGGDVGLGGGGLGGGGSGLGVGGCGEGKGEGVDGEAGEKGINGGGGKDTPDRELGGGEDSTSGLGAGTEGGCRLLVVEGGLLGVEVLEWLSVAHNRRRCHELGWLVVSLQWIEGPTLLP